MNETDRLCILALVAVEGIGAASINRLVRAARDARLSLEEMLASHPQRLVSEFGLPEKSARLVTRIRSPALKGTVLQEQLKDAGVQLIFQDSKAYPPLLMELLGVQAPAALFVRGASSLLRVVCTAVVGSRRPTRRAREAAFSFASTLARAGQTVVSGAARGIDSAAHLGALETGATAIIPAMGVSVFNWRSTGAANFPPGRVCVVGQFPPLAGWKTAQALMRNRTIVALSQAVVAFEPRDTGGTRHSSLTALSMGKPLFVVCCSAAPAKRRGLKQLVDMGAVAIDPDNMPDAVAFERLVRDYVPPPRPSQLPLF